uniref:Peptidase M24 domain-containing protein n=1 Tax=Glossina morsitans morsitans TaxID=37546 RepID=A0A1B0G100_GLOMM
MKKLFLNLSIGRIIQRLSKNKKNFGRFDKVVLGNVSPERSVPLPIEKPDYYYRFMPLGDTSSGEPEIKTDEQIIYVCKLTSNTLKACEGIIKVGVKTDEVDAFLHELIISSNAYPSPLRYVLDNTALNRIATDCLLKLPTPLHNYSQITTIILRFPQLFSNYGLKFSNYAYLPKRHITFIHEKAAIRQKYLFYLSEATFLIGSNLRRSDERVDRQGTSNHINKFCKGKGLNVITAFIGHGIGTYFHGPPEILHFKNNFPGIMQRGMTFTIEPILTFGGPEVEIQKDGWTATTLDGARTAQFEHTILITETGAEVLTKPD